ncbi:uncharacterized protein PHACADRAFT_193712 [Phanerochaete carnosa HHB-10118-sp]|uniref:BTB domain-containing protein n=1 Tax=Phanerochaete carnosa (strain HHB-10118-sp) TaxID=650164 RepID=K5WHI7_PHACS|nr:uncharacterized protein PHACADRAFT_193712 [Phanerochaete carnosa HHB-10118-sp]EKM58579.1 hypothetical protein PHACADRAFT_193712 [Phanerochaete carnosa HHB-10118-sp]
MAFRVHSDIFSRHFEDFRKLMSSSALAALSESLDGCPVLRTTDSGTYLSKLVGILYDGGASDWFHRKMTTVPFDELRGIAIVAARYKVRAVIDEVLARLSQCFPSSDLSRFNGNLDFSGWPNPPIGIRQEDAIAAVKLAKLLEAPFLLPAAFAVCAGIDYDCLVKGVVYGDEVVRLDDEELLSCLGGQGLLLEENTQVMKTLLEFIVAAPSSLKDKCRNRSDCNVAIGKLALSAVEIGHFATPCALDPMDGWFSDVYQARPDLKPCTHCQKALQNTVNKRREETWQKLGGIYGVAPWPVANK